MDYSYYIKESFKEEFLQFETYLREAIKNPNPRIMNIVNHIFKRDGKRIRPILVFLAAKATGEITPQTYHGAVTVELLHTATLVHDDVVDEAKLRRSQASINAVYDNQRAVLTGDYLLSSSLEESVRTNSLEVVKIIAELGKKLSEGELNQYALANEIIIDEAEYFEVIEKKTASLLEACMRIGAITSGAETSKVEKLGEVGRLLGIAFQLRDDIFDYYKTDVGKPTGNDIREGKITLPLIYALKNSHSQETEDLQAIIHTKDFTETNIEKLLTFAKDNGGVDYTYQLIDKYLTDSQKIISELHLKNEVGMLLDMLLKYLKNRSI